jgi:DNA-binding LytR/AlgR family response regulator
MTASLDVLVVDDELPPLEDLTRILQAHPKIARVEGVMSASDAMIRVANHEYDSIFLDVRMPGLDGLELGRVLNSFERPPALVFVTAYETAAVTAFELRAVDYLLKPVTPERVAEAVERVAAVRAHVAREAPAERDALEPTQHDPKIMMVENIVGGGVRLIPRDSVLYLEARGDYLRVVADSGRFVLRDYLATLEPQLSPHGFVRVHRKYVVNLQRAVEIRTLANGTGELLLDNGGTLPIARRQLPELRRWLRGQ